MITVALLALLAWVLCRALVQYIMEPARWWVTTEHTIWTRLCCAAGVHLRGYSGQSCLHNITVCKHCRRDVLFVLKDLSE